MMFPIKRYSNPPYGSYPMPLRDHFRPPVSKHSSWEGFHAGWPATMVMQLSRILPDDYSAEPRVHLGTYFDIDDANYEDHSPKSNSPGADLTEEYAYEVLIYDRRRGRELVAAIEIICPGNKHRPLERTAFITKCLALLQQRICVSIIDLVTTMRFNLYAEMLASFEKFDPAFAKDPSPTYAVSCRGRKIDGKPRLEVWSYPLIVGQPLPSLPIWLSEDLVVPLSLEASYEEACRALRIP